MRIALPNRILGLASNALDRRCKDSFLGLIAAHLEDTIDFIEPTLEVFLEALKHARGSLFPAGLVKILYYRRLIKNVRVLALGVVEEYRASGLAAGFYATLVASARKLGFGDCEMSWILEDNVLMNRSLEVMGAKRYKTYRIYEAPLERLL